MMSFLFVMSAFGGYAHTHTHAYIYMENNSWLHSLNLPLTFHYPHMVIIMKLDFLNYGKSNSKFVYERVYIPTLCTACNVEIVFRLNKYTPERRMAKFNGK